MTVPAPWPPYANDLLAAPLIGAGMPLVTSGRLTLAQLEAAVAAVSTLAEAAWVYAATDTGKTDIAALIVGWVKQAPADYQGRYDAAVHAAEVSATALADSLINPSVEHVPIVGKLVASAADAIIAKLIDAQGAKFIVPAAHHA